MCLNGGTTVISDDADADVAERKRRLMACPRERARAVAVLTVEVHTDVPEKNGGGDTCNNNRQDSVSI